MRVKLVVSNAEIITSANYKNRCKYNDFNEDNKLFQ